MPEEAALAALADACADADGPATTAAVMERFAASVHLPILTAALVSAEDQGVTPEHAEERLRDGTARWWRQAKLAGKAPADEGPPLSEEDENKLRQLEWVRRALPARPGESSG
jgi:hypothetical protein